jgi:MFS family permease
MRRSSHRNVIAISLSQFGMAFSFNFTMVILPFYILKVSPYSLQETLIWTGWIMGFSALVMTISSYFWGMLTSRFSPKLLFLGGILTNAIVFLLMGFTSSLHILLLLRILQGLMGGISTIGLIIVSSSSPRERLSADIGFYQTFLTLGFLVGPPLGALGASAFGYRGAFSVGSGLGLLVVIYCHFQVADIPRTPKRDRILGGETFNRQTIPAWILCLAVTVQLMFLPSILPNVLESFKMDKAAALKWSGTIIMLYTATATLGTYLLSRLSANIRKERMIVLLIILGTLFQSSLALSRGMVGFIIIRMIQTGLIAATIPLVISIFAAERKGGTIGFLNSARFAGNGLGSILATSLLAFSNLTVLYLSISAMTLLALVGFRFSLARGQTRDMTQGPRADEPFHQTTQ